MEREDLVSLITTAEKFHNLGGFKMNSNTSLLPKKNLDLFTKNLNRMRKCYHMEMWKSGTTQLFSSHSVPELFQHSCKPPIKATTIFSISYIQNITNQLHHIYEDSSLFASVVSEYFKYHPKEIDQFAFGLFPTIYICFLGQEFSQRAANFIATIISETDNFKLSAQLVSIYFKAAPLFYQRLWNLLNIKLCMIKEPPFEKIFKGFQSSLSLSVSLLTQYHVLVLAVFREKYPKKVRSFFVKKLLLNEFNSACYSSELLPLKNQNEVIRNFFETIKMKTHEDLVTTLLDTITQHRQFVEVIPSMSNWIWSKGIPIIISFSDLKDLTNILKSSPKFSIHPLPDLNIDNDFDEFSLTIFPSFINISPLEIGIMQPIAGECPPSIPIPDNDEFKKLWISCIRRAKNEGIDKFTLISKLNISNPKFLKFCYISIIAEYRSNYEQLAKNMILSENEMKLREIKDSITCYIELLFQHFSQEYFHTSIYHLTGGVIERINKSIGTLVGDQRISPRYNYLSCIIALNSISISISKSFIYHQKFQNLLDKWIENEFNTCKQRTYISQKMKYIMNCSNKISNLSDLPWGKRLLQLLDFAKHLRLIIDVPNWNEYWDSFMILSIYLSSSKDILPIFLFFYHCLFSNLSIIGKWPKDCKSDFDRLSYGIMNILGTNSELFKACSNPVLIRQLYAISE